MLTTRYILCCPTPQCCSFRILHVKSLGHLHSKCYCKHKNISQIEDSNSLCSFTLLLTLFRLLQLQLVCLASCSLYPSYLTHRLGSCCRHPNRTQLILRPHSCQMAEPSLGRSACLASNQHTFNYIRQSLRFLK